MRYSFPLAFMANTFAMTVLLIALGLTGHSVMAAEVGVVQAATLALLYAFSANARSLILNKKSGVSAYSVMLVRLLLLVPLAVLSYWLSAGVAQVDWLLAIILILRRCVEWLGEVHLSETERLDDQGVAKKYFLLQSILLAILLGWLIGDFRFPLLGLFIWAFLPLVFSLRFIFRLVTTASNALNGVIGKMLPNLGSTAIIGITVYVFRVLILLATDKVTAGDLFTAFAIGGVTGSIFANALGASLAHYEQSSGKAYLPPFLRHVLNISMALGALLFIAAVEKASILSFTGKSFFFWEATGLSMIGGVVMVYAQKIRFKLLQHDSEHDVFGPDVMMNIFMFASVPFVFYMFGKEAMSTLFLLNAALAYVFYASAKKEAKEYAGIQVYSPRMDNFLRMAIAILMLLPLFFQLNKGIFHDSSFTFDSGGLLKKLPIPASLLACYIGILLMGSYRRAFESFGYIFFTCVLMILSTIIVTQDLPALQQAKFLLLIQLMLPMFALVLGRVYERWNMSADDDKTYAKAFFWVLVIVLPIQLFFTLKDGKGYLSPELGLFSIYQFLQYVPVIFVSAYLLSLFALWHFPKYKAGLLCLSGCMALYVAASISMLAIGMFFLGLLVFAIRGFKMHKEKLPCVVVFLALILSWNYYQYEKEDVAFKFGYISRAVSTFVDEHETSLVRADIAVSDKVVVPVTTKSNEIIPSVGLRVKYWEYYIGVITSSPEAFLFGSVTPPDRAEYPSAHNYYLDFIYNFGVFALLPTLFLVGFTIIQIFRQRRDILTSPVLLSLSLVLLFLLMVDNSMKVSLRQPYSGIFIFFVWGILIAKLSKLKTNHAPITV